MSLRIACDLDGTVADMDSALQQEAQRLFGPDADLHAFPGDRVESAEDVEGHMQSPGTGAGIGGRRALSGREVARLWQHVGEVENFWASLAEVEPGAVAQLAATARRLRWEIIFLTQRPAGAGEITQVQSQRWLQAHGFELPSVMVMRGSRGKVATALGLDVVIDDRPENCLDVLADSQAKPILIWRFGRDKLPAGLPGPPLETVSSIAETLVLLEALTAARGRGQTFFGRVKQAFGFTP